MTTYEVAEGQVAKGHGSFPYPSRISRVKWPARRHRAGCLPRVLSPPALGSLGRRWLAAGEGSRGAAWPPSALSPWPPQRRNIGSENLITHIASSRVHGQAPRRRAGRRRGQRLQGVCV